MRFGPGATAMRRFFKRGDTVSVVKTCRVISDDERGLLLWIATGSPVRWLKAADGRGLHDMSFAEWLTVPKQLQRRVWQGPGILTLVPPGAAHTVWWFFRADGGFDRWYVNLERPPVRWQDGQLAGLDSVDHDLDVVAFPDGSWHWKDEHELVERLAYPEHYWVADAAAVRAEGERVVKLFEARRFPFDGTWCEFRPDPHWPVPAELPAGWDRPRAGA